MDRFWTKEYPAGVPAEINPDSYSSLVELMEESFDKYRNDPAYVLMDKYISYGELDQKSADMGAYLQSLGLERGDRVAIMLPNVLQYPITALAILRAGFIIVNVNPLYTSRELEHQLNDSGAKAIIILENFAKVLENVVDKTPVKHVVVASIGEMLGFPKGAIVNFVLRSVKKQVPAYTLAGHVKFNDAVKQGAGRTLQKAELTGDDVAVLQYTGGTTGPSKGATLLHRTLISALLMSEAWLKPGLERKGPIEGQTTFICALPLYHVFAFVSCSLLGIRAGGLCVLIPNPRDLDASIKTMSKFKFHIFPAVNTLFNGLAAHPEFAKLDFSQLRISNGGGMAVTQAVAERWLKITGCPICEGYGLSETSSGITCNPTDTDAFTGTVGVPMPNVEVRMVDEDGKEVPLGERGEIAIRGPQVMAGYWQKPDATAAAFTADGFFKSGDIGTMDEQGYCRVVDRIKDMIIASGFNIYPGEIEDVTGACPGVLETACVGVPDEKSGEAVVLYVIKEDPDLSETVIRAYCAQNLTGYKKPKYVVFKDEFPKTNVGKILRRELRDEALATIGKQ